ncbi:hypothetical protein K0H19_07160 [Phocaeicola vulgatus]|uniref:hypothetical protein n=1 Tax=Phocaeicola vulgatus TaxID=821 RepID=UPI001F3C0D5D|nr:hypothetical protein [Phocaeicola vulgatus]MCE9351941.1 hypothetical protein [Phocaeicola vulgatus]
MQKAEREIRDKTSGGKAGKPDKEKIRKRKTRTRTKQTLTVKDRLPESAATTHFNLNTIHIILRKTRILHAKKLLATLNKVRY